MLEEVLAAGDKALVFTQFREMGDKLVAQFRDSLGCEVIFLHGGTPKKQRDDMVRRFQDDPRGPRIFVLSMKAGGISPLVRAAAETARRIAMAEPNDGEEPADTFIGPTHDRAPHVRLPSRLEPR